MDKIFEGWRWAGYDAPSYEVAFGPDRTTLTLPLTYAGAESAEDSTAIESDDNHQISSSDTAETQNDARAAKTSENKRHITEYLMMNGPSKSSDIAESIGLKVARTNQILRSMVADGTVAAEGAARSRRYRLAGR